LGHGDDPLGLVRLGQPLLCRAQALAERRIQFLFHAKPGKGTQLLKAMAGCPTPALPSVFGSSRRRIEARRGARAHSCLIFIMRAIRRTFRSSRSCM
jgi:hypothetical protein